MQIARSVSMSARWQDRVLAGSAFLLLPVLVLAPRGAVLLVCCAGLAAASLVWKAEVDFLRCLRGPIAVFVALLLLGAASALWSITPPRSLVVAGRIGGLAIAGWSLVAAAPLVRGPPMLLALAAGASVGIVLAMIEVATGGVLTNMLFTRGFVPTRVNEAATVMAVLVLPLAATPLAGSWRPAMLPIAVAIAITIGVLSGTTAKIALVIGLAVAGAFLLDYRRVARIAAVLVALTIVTAPLTFSRLAQSQALLETADAVKTSASHRLLIWSFVGDRIAERPLLGWGLDTSRAIPGGKELFRPGQEKLPLHPHNAALQLWLELGAPGAVLGALLLGGFFYALGVSDWPRLYIAATGGTLTITLAGLLDSFSLWNESWQAVLWYSAFLVLVLARRSAGAKPIAAPIAERRAVAVGV